MKEDQYTQAALLGRPVPGFVVDIHGHLGENNSFRILHHDDIDLFVHEMDRHGVDVCGVSAVPAAIGGIEQGGNAAVLEAVRRHPDRFFGWAAANPHYPDAMMLEIERCYEAGCRGIKIHNSIGLAYDHENYVPLYEFAAGLGLPVLAHSWGGELDLMRPLFEKYPGVKWSLAHAGASEADKYVDVARRYENVYLDTCYSRSPRGLIEHFVRSGVGNKTMFSSDSCFMGLAQQLGRVLLADLTAEEKAMVLGGNAKRFLGALCP